MKTKFIKNIKELFNQPCVKVVGGDTGSIIAIDFGKLVPVNGIVSNNYDNHPYLRGEYGLMIDCAWRLDAVTEVLCGSEDDLRSLFNFHFNKLVSEKVISTKLTEPAYDLEIEFSNNYILKLFCNNTNPEAFDNNYDFFTPEGCFSVGCKGEINFEKNNM